MGNKIAEVNAFEAKTRLSELLRETERGKSFIIRRRNKVVARLLPPEKGEQAKNLAQILISFREIRKKVSGKLKIAELIEEGRRY